MVQTSALVYSALFTREMSVDQNALATIGLIEDDDRYARHLERNLRRVRVRHDLAVFHDGGKALECLFIQLVGAEACGRAHPD